MEENLSEEIDPVEEEESLEGPKPGEKTYKLPEYLVNLNPDRRQVMLNLHVLASRERFLKRARQAYKNFLASLKAHLKGKGWEFTRAHLLEEQIATIDKMILQVEKDIKIEIETLPIWTRFLKNIKGLGPGTAGAILAQIGEIKRFRSISALRKYSGWYPEDGKAARMIKGAKTGYSTKMKQYLYHFSAGIMRAKDPYYYPLFAEFKAQLYAKHPEWVERKATKGERIEGIPIHVKLMAERKIRQMFLSDLFCIWRDLEGLPQTVPYAVGILGHEGFIDPMNHPYYEKPGPNRNPGDKCEPHE